MDFTITMGPVRRPQRVLLYGPEGIGKSTLAARMPDPVFVDVEDGTSHLECARLPVPVDWGTLLAEVLHMAGNPGAASTVVVDTADAAEALCQRFVCSQRGKSGIEDFGYGKGYVYARDEFRKLLDALDHAVEAGLNVVVVGHAQMRKFERPDESGAYDRFELKLNKHVSSLVKEWADAVLFCDWETFVSVDDNGRAKASGGRRVIRCDHSPVWDAKNRWGLPDTIALDADGVALVRENLTVRDPGEAAPAPAATAEPAAPETAPPPHEMGLDETKAHAARLAALPDRLAPIREIVVEGNVTLDEIEAVMVWKGKRERGQRVESWEDPFVEWVASQRDAVLGLVSELRRTREVAGAVGIPF